MGISFDFERQRKGAQVERRFGAAEDAENFLAAGNNVGSLVQKCLVLLFVKTSS
jgi:hypothetical protein